MVKSISYFPRYAKVLTSTLLIGSPVAYLVYLHNSLSSTINHARQRGVLTSSTAPGISSIPASAFLSTHSMVHDRAYKAVPVSRVPAVKKDELITLYLRHTMGFFSSRFPQSYLLRFVVPFEQKKTFSEDHISNLDFKEGDVVCGLYRVTARTKNKVEFEMTPVGIVQGGRMSIGIQRKGDEWICSSETVMWKKAGEKELMPLERRAIRWMHELAAWWLLEAGTRYLIDLKKSN